jgi:predicted nucleotidyltransferase
MSEIMDTPNRSLSELKQLVPNLTITSLRDSAVQIREKVPYLKMLVLFGSRARGDCREDSDYDFAALYDEEMRHAIADSKKRGLLNIYSHLTNIFDLPTELVEVVRLNECSKSIAHIVSKDGLLIYEKETGEFERFRDQSLMSVEDFKKHQNQQIQDLKLAVKAWRIKHGN